MKAKLLKRLRKRFQIHQEGDFYYVVDWQAINWDNTYPSYHTASKNLDVVKQQRRELILSSFKRKYRVIKVI